MRLRLKMASVLIGTAGLLVPIAGAASAQAAPVSVGTTPTCIVKAKPYSFVEQGEGVQASSVAFIVVVECQPVYGEDTVEINAHQLSSACHGTLSWTNPAVPGVLVPGESFDVTLDNDGNANAVVWGGPSCAASNDLITADLTSPPYYTAKTYVVIKPPADTPPGLYVYPRSLVEDETTSSVAAIFYAEFPSYDSQQTVQFSDDQLYNRCHGSITWYGPDETLLSAGTKSVYTTLDNNGNAFVVAVAGPSCAAGYTLGEVELETAPYTTYTHGFRVLSPRVTV
jgi:hypothetical protein